MGIERLQRELAALAGCPGRDVDKKCDREEEDLNSGHPVHVVVGERDKGFSLRFPSSSSCLDNHY